VSKFGQSLIQAAEEALAIAQGRLDPATYVVHHPVDVKAIRARLGLAQAEFALQYGLSVGTVRDWEQGRSVPDRPAQILLRVIEADPEFVRRVVAARS
jgi:putative transcriptional regulator